MPKYGVHSEVGQLRTVLVCRPGLAHQRLTPGNRADLLFDDGLTSINNELAGASTLTGLSLTADHRHALETAAPIYRRYWWADLPKFSRTCPPSRPH